MTNAEQPSRLDRIEAILERVATNQESLQQTVLQNTAAIAELKQDLQDSISHLVKVIGDFAEEAHNDREQAKTERQAFREQAAADRQQAAIDRQEFRTEIRHIWEYLRDRNGGSSPPGGN